MSNDLLIKPSMELADYSRMLLGSMRVYEENNQVFIDGIPGREYSNDIYKIWRSSKIADNLFTRVRGSSLSFYKFFAPEILYTLEVTRHSRRGTVNKRVIDKTIEELQTHTWLANTVKQHPDILNFKRLDDLAMKPLDHQMEFLETYNRVVPQYGLNGYLLAAPPGSGKTYTNIATSHCLEADLTIVISPNNALYKVWQKTISSTMEGITYSMECVNGVYDLPVEVSMESLISKVMFKEPQKVWTSQDNKPFPSDCKYFVFHYEALSRAFDLLRSRNYKKICIILDESHNFNDLKSQRTKMFVNLCQEANCKHVLWASGTPIKAIGSEAIPLLRTIDPLFTAPVEEAFSKIYGKSAQKGLDILQHRMGLITYKVAKEVVRKGEPEYKQIKVKLDDKEAHRYTLESIKLEMRDYALQRMKFYNANMKFFEKEYDRCLMIHSMTLTSKEERDAFNLYKDHVQTIRREYDPVLHKKEAAFCNEYEDKKIIPSLDKHDKKAFKEYKSIVKYVHLKVQGECLGRVLGKRRSECNTALVKHAGLENIVDEAAKKTLIFSSFVDTIKEADKYLTDLGFDTCMVYADTNKEVTAIVTRFEKEPDLNPCLATYKSLSTAIPMVSANTVVLLDQPFREHEKVQAIARVDRLDQDTQVYVFDVLLDTGDEPNISTRSKDILDWSKAQVEMIMGEETPDNLDEMLFTAAFGNVASGLKSLPLMVLADRMIDELTKSLRSMISK